MSLGKTGIMLGHGDQLLVVLVKQCDLVFGKVLDINQPVAGALHCSDYFVQFEMYRQRILVLSSLNQKYHQKGDNGGARVYHELPRVGKVEHRAGDCPDYEYGQCD